MLYAMSPMLQKDEVDYYCFKTCQKVLIGGIDLGDYGPAVPCRQDHCPYEADRTPIVGQANDEDVIVRKLIPVTVEERT